jgi:DNA-binding CsgD family transcriptional regulator
MLDAIYDAGLAPHRWPDVLSAVADTLGGNAAMLHVGPSAGPLPIVAASGVGEAASRAYGDRYGALDPAVGAAARSGASNAPITARSVAGAGWERTEFFAEWMRPNGFDDMLCLGLSPPDAAHQVAASVARPPCAPRFGPVEAALLARLASHLRRAVEMHRRLSSAQAVSAEPFTGALDRLAAGVALVDASGVLVWANRTANGLLRAGDGLSLDRNSALRATTPGTTDALRRMISAASVGAEGALPVPRPSGRAALALHAVPLTARAAGAAAREPVLPPAAPRPSVLLLLSDPERGAMADAALHRRLRAVYGLTAAEATVAAHAAHGVGLPEVAQSLGLAVATARTHAQRVFSKAGVRGQAELARQIERLSLLRAAERAE